MLGGVSMIELLDALIVFLSSYYYCNRLSIELTGFQSGLISLVIAIVFYSILVNTKLGVVLKVLATAAWTFVLSVLLPIYAWTNGNKIWCVIIYVLIFYIVLCLHKINIIDEIKELPFLRSKKKSSDANQWIADYAKEYFEKNEVDENCVKKSKSDENEYKSIIMIYNDRKAEFSQLTSKKVASSEYIKLKKDGECIIEKIDKRLETINENNICFQNDDLKNEIMHSLDDVIFQIKECIETMDIKDGMTRLNNLVGLNSVKSEVNRLIDHVKVEKVRELNGLKTTPMSLHLVFKGNPGTGKTEVAKIIGSIYREIGVLSKGDVVSVTRSDLVGEYVGKTAQKTKKKIEEAIGGVLFIDEAYTLLKKGSSNDYGQEAIDELLTAMEEYRNDFIVIVAGYPDLMEEFIHSNPGLESRFSKKIVFEDYTEDELFDIFDLMIESADYYIEPLAAEKVKEMIHQMKLEKKNNFGNAREIRKLFEKIIGNQSSRMVAEEKANGKTSKNELITITEKDIF